MKKQFAIIMLILISSVAYVQAQDEIEQDWRLELPRHEVGLGIGDPFMALLYRPGDYSYDSSPHETWFNDRNYYHGPVYTTCPISFHYLYRVAKFLWLGGTFSYCGVYAKRYEMCDRAQIGWMNEHYLTLMPTIRFSYLNKKYVTLYSGVSTGCVLGIVSPTKLSARPDVQCYFAGQLTAFGVSTGNKWYGFTEIGIGYNGFVRAGFGYRFNKDKNNN